MQPQHVSDSALARALVGTPYRYIGLLGRGGMGCVVEAEHIGLAKLVAVKLLQENMCDSPELVDRMRIEAQVLARIEHPNLVRVLDFAMTGAGRAYLVMERLDGVTLQATELEQRGFSSRRRSIPRKRRRTRRRAGCRAVHRDEAAKPASVPGTGAAASQGVGLDHEGNRMRCSRRVAPPRFVTHRASASGRLATAHRSSLRTCDPAGYGRVARRASLYGISLGAIRLNTAADARSLTPRTCSRCRKPPSAVAPCNPAAVDRLCSGHGKRPSDRFPTAADLAREIDAIRRERRPPSSLALCPRFAPKGIGPATRVTAPADGAHGQAAPTLLSAPLAPAAPTRRSRPPLARAELAHQHVGRRGFVPVSPARCERGKRFRECGKRSRGTAQNAPRTGAEAVAAATIRAGTPARASLPGYARCGQRDVDSARISFVRGSRARTA
jgi:serine/threonine-protein kinase